MGNGIFDYVGKSANLGALQQADEVAKVFKEAFQRGYMPERIKTPLFAMWEITSRCPQDCIYCYNSSPRKVDELSSKQLFMIADQLLESKIFSICITGGEPTQRKEYFELIRYLSDGGLRLGTALSGANLNKKRIEKIAHYISEVQISLDGASANVHDGVRKRKGSYNDAVSAILEFKALGVPIKISFASTKYNVDDFAKVYELCQKWGVAELRTQKLAISGKVKGKDNDICPTDEQYERLFEFIKEHKNEGMIGYGDPSVHIRNGYEMGISSLARITAEGNVGITPYADIFFGNVKEKPLTEIFEKLSRGWKHETVRECIRNGSITTDDEVIKDNIANAIYI